MKDKEVSNKSIDYMIMAFKFFMALLLITTIIYMVIVTYYVCVGIGLF